MVVQTVLHRLFTATACMCSCCRVLQAREMVYKRMVEIGRVVFIARGDNSGKLAAIVDVVDGNRVKKPV